MTKVDADHIPNMKSPTVVDIAPILWASRHVSVHDKVLQNLLVKFGVIAFYLDGKEVVGWNTTLTTSTGGVFGQTRHLIEEK